MTDLKKTKKAAKSAKIPSLLIEYNKFVKIN